MFRWLVKLILHGVIVFVIAKHLNGFSVSTLGAAVLFSLILGLVNTFIRPIITIITLPVTILTLGLFRLVINGVLFLTVAHFIKGIHIHGFVTAVIASIIVTILSHIVDWIVDAIMN